MLAGTSAFLLTYVFGGSQWTIIGSTIMGIGSLTFVLAICWYLANTPGDQDDDENNPLSHTHTHCESSGHVTDDVTGDQDDERRRCESSVQIHVVDERHLARLIKQGACVKNVGVV